MTDGIADAGTDMDALMKRVNADEVSSSDFFGTREFFLKNNYLYCYAGAKLGRYGNSGRRRSISPISSTAPSTAGRVESQLHAALSQRPVTAG